MGGEPVAHMLRRQREKQAIDIARMVGLAPSSEVQFTAIVAGYLHRFQSQMLDAIADPSEAIITLPAIGPTKNTGNPSAKMLRTGVGTP